MPADFFGSTLNNVLYFAVTSAPFWAPVGLGIIAWTLWVHYIQRANINDTKWVLLQMRVPRDIFKSPAAMELFFVSALYQSGGVNTWYKKFWLGNVPAWFSLEMVSIEGRLFFFIYTQERFRAIIEAQIYAQYPQVEILEVDDYASLIPPHTKDGEWNMWGCEFVLTKEDPYPIKTYIDYGLDKATGSLEEEEKIDPLTSVLEFMGSIGKGEQVWFQILVRAANWARYPDPKSLFNKIKWTELGQTIVNELKLKQQKPLVEGGAPIRSTKGEQDILSALERSITKYGFDAGIRGIYLAQQDRYQSTRISALTGTFRQFNSPTLNGFKIKNETDVDYPWQDFSGHKREEKKKDLLDAYRLRSYFYDPYARIPFVLNTEELATIFHFPGRVLETPSFARIDSKKSEPPGNLPQ